MLAGRGVGSGSRAEPGDAAREVPAGFTLLLPVDEDGRAAARLWAGLIARACVDKPTPKLAAQAYTNLTEFVVRQLRGAMKES